MEGQDVCARKAKPVKPLAITSIFNTLFPLDGVDAKGVIVSMSVKNNFTPYIQLEKCGGNCAVFNRTEWQELGNYKSVISKFFTNTQPPQKISLTNHEISLRHMCATCEAIHTVTDITAGKLREHINLPPTRAETEATMQWFKRTGGFPVVVAAVDGTHIPILNPGGERGEVYSNRHGVFSINVQVACGAHLKIVDIVARRPGSFHDASIFGASSLKSRFEQGRVERILLGDSGYPCLPYLLTPLLNARTEVEQRYNTAHIATRNPVERLFGLWKRRFRCLAARLWTKHSQVMKCPG